MTPERWQQIDKLLEEALERVPNERAAFLDQACAGDEALRQKVEALLASHERAESFIETPALEAAAQALAGQSRSMLGQQLNHYRILSLLGKGGMGEVYRARDNRIGREVAIKVLPAAFSQDADRLWRFEQEARAAGMLNHPNILTVHDIGTHDGAPYIVSELLEGETLYARLNGSAFTSRKAIEYALQVARGLAAAHEKGIVHRDLKPENLFLTRDGRLKILDFGLAKLKPQIMSDVAKSQAPTAALLTAPGVIMGTVGYMSPEQASGEEADHRADIFSFGAILYEMMTGKRAFQGKTSIEVLNAILNDEPAELAEASEAGRQFAPGPERVLRRCLEKNPRERFQSASDLAFAIESLSVQSGLHLGAASRSSSSVFASRFNRFVQPSWIAATGLLIATLALAWLYYRHIPTDTSAVRFFIHPPEKTAFQFFVGPPSVAVSPDGQRLALVTAAEGRTQLWVRSLDATAAQPLANTEGAVGPFWSPDSRFIGFFADGKLKKIEAAGGPPQTLCDVPQWDAAATWNHEDVILFSADDGIYRVSAEGGKPAQVNRPDQTGEIYHAWPSFLPDGQHFLFMAGGVEEVGGDIYVGSLDSSVIKLLVKDASRAAYAPPGYVLYVRDGTLLAQPFDARALRFTGEPMPIAEHLQHFKPIGYADFSVSQNGLMSVLAYRAGTDISRLAWFDRRGVEIGSVSTPKHYSVPRLSPDGQSAAAMVIEARTGTTDIWIYDLSRGTSTRLTFDPRLENAPIWSPDGRRIVFAAERDGPPHLHQKALDQMGSGEVLIPRSQWVQWPYDWSLDGRFIIYGDGGLKAGHDLILLPMFGDRKPAPFLDSQFHETEARFSPDSRWIAYVSNESGQNEVYVRSFPGAGPGVMRQISVAGGTSPSWRRDGRELFYLAPDKRLMVVPVRAGASFEAGAPTALFRVEVGDVVARDTPYDVAADGQRFLINVKLVEAKLLPITVVVNWSAAVKR